MSLVPLPAFADNYIWMLHDGRSAVVVDPGDAAPVIAALQAHALELAGILVTHHHPDHVGGVDALRPLLRGPVWAPAGEATPEPRIAVAEGDEVAVLGRRFEVIEVPGHTAGHIAYAERDAAVAPLLFCGDTLFSAGCGRMFEGTPAQFHASLQKLAALADDTRVCAAHEYTLSNLRFAAAVEPENVARQQHQAWCEAQRAAGQPTLPARLATERAINPFLRCAEPGVVAAARAHGAADASGPEVFGALRRWKDGFR